MLITILPLCRFYSKTELSSLTGLHRVDEKFVKGVIWAWKATPNNPFFCNFRVLLKRLTLHHQTEKCLLTFSKLRI